MPVRHVGLAQIFVKTNRHSVDNMAIVTSTLFIYITGVFQGKGFPLTTGEKTKIQKALQQYHCTILPCTVHLYIH